MKGYINKTLCYELNGKAALAHTTGTHQYKFIVLRHHHIGICYAVSGTEVVSK